MNANKRLIKAERSPYCPALWIVTLECGHVRYFTKERPGIGDLVECKGLRRGKAMELPCQDRG